jgi:hypothetical protein
MRKLLPILLLLAPLAADVCVAQEGAIVIMCDDCRDPEEYPDDYVNFAFNQLYGPDAWLSYEQADDFFVTNLLNQRVYVDVDFMLLGIGFQGLRLPFWPTYLLQITLALPSGDLYTAVRSVFQTSLPVPSSDDSGTTDSGDSGGDGDGDDEDEGGNDADLYEWEEPEFGENEGVTGIEDPDEDGWFSDPDWCQEC